MGYSFYVGKYWIPMSSRFRGHRTGVWNVVWYSSSLPRWRSVLAVALEGLFPCLGSAIPGQYCLKWSWCKRILPSGEKATAIAQSQWPRVSVSGLNGECKTSEHSCWHREIWRLSPFRGEAIRWYACVLSFSVSSSYNSCRKCPPAGQNSRKRKHATVIEGPGTACGSIFFFVLWWNLRYRRLAAVLPLSASRSELWL